MGVCPRSLACRAVRPDQGEASRRRAGFRRSWRNCRALGDILPIYRKSGNQLIADAYRRSAEAMGWTPLQKSAASLFYRDGSDANVRTSLATAAGDRQGSAIGRAAAAAALARILETAGRGDEYLA